MRFMTQKEAIEEWWNDFVNSPLFITMNLTIDEWNEAHDVCVNGKEWDIVLEEDRNKILGWFKENPRIAPGK